MQDNFSIQRMQKRAPEAAKDMLNVRMAWKRELIDEQINGIDAKIGKLRERLLDSRKKDLVEEKEMLTQRAKHIWKLPIRGDKCSLKTISNVRRHEAVMYVNYRVKMKDFLTVANYSL